MRKVLNWVLFCIFLICIIFALKYSTLPTWSLIPNEISKWFVLSKEELENYVFLYDIFMGIAVSYIFYVFVELIPTSLHVYRSKRLVSEDIDLLLHDMHFLIVIILHVFDIDVPIKRLGMKNLLIINGNTKISKNGFYLEQIYSNKLLSKGKRITGAETSFSYPIDIKNTLNKISDNLEFISSMEGFFSSNEQLAECIISLKKSKFIEWYKNNEKSYQCFLFANTSNELMKLIDIYIKLCKMNYHKKYYSIRILTDEEASNRPTGYATYLAKVAKRNQKILTLNPCLIYNGMDNNAKIISNEIVNCFYSRHSMIDDRIPDISNNKLVVIILDYVMSLNEKKYTNLVNKLPLNGKHVIFLKPYTFFRTRNKFNEKNLCRLDSLKTIYYKSSLDICSISINKDQPSTITITNIDKSIYEFIDII